MATLVGTFQITPGVTTDFTPGGYFTTLEGDRILLWVGGKYDTTTTPTISSPWQLIGRWNGGTGSAGNDTGTTWLALYAWDSAADGDMEFNVPTVTAGATAPNTWLAYMEQWRPATGLAWTDALADLDDQTATVSDTSTATPFGGSLPFTTFPSAGGLSVNGISPSDTALSGIMTQTASSTGMSGGSQSGAGNANINDLGQDCSQWWLEWTGWTGTGSTGVTIDFHSTGGSNHSGVIAGVFLREAVSVDPTELVITLLAQATMAMSFEVTHIPEDPDDPDPTPDPIPVQTMTMRILDPDQRRSPTAITVTISGAWPGGLVTFAIDTVDVYTAYADGSGSITALSIPVNSSHDAGSHTLLATSEYVDLDDLTASAPFTLRNNPATGHVVGPDADPVEIDDAIQDDGHRHWVFQDLMPGGLGSYVFSHNPIATDRPWFERSLSAARTTGSNGRYHVSESRVRYAWRVTGKAFTQDEVEVLEAWEGLNRRFYVIDDYGDAWVVAMSDLDVTPSLRQNLQLPGQPAELTDWLQDFAMTLIVMNRDPLTPVVAP